MRGGEGGAGSRGATGMGERHRPENEPGVGAFRAAGYYGFATREGVDGPMLHCERRLADFG